MSMNSEVMKLIFDVLDVPFNSSGCMRMDGDMMVVRCRRRVAATVVILSLLVVLVLVIVVLDARQSFVCLCPTESSHTTTLRPVTQHSTEHAWVAARSYHDHYHSQRDDFQRDVLRPTESLPTVVKTKVTTTKSAASKLSRPQQFVFHRCPVSYSITDEQDEWFRTVVIQRSPPTRQVTFTEEILIVTPIFNSERHLRRYFENLCSLAYPHRLMTVVLGEDSSNDNTVQVNARCFCTKPICLQVSRSAGHMMGSRHLAPLTSFCILLVRTFNPQYAHTVSSLAGRQEVSDSIAYCSRATHHGASR